MGLHFYEVLQKEKSIYIVKEKLLEVVSQQDKELADWEGACMEIEMCCPISLARNKTLSQMLGVCVAESSQCLTPINMVIAYSEENFSPVDTLCPRGQTTQRYKGQAGPGPNLGQL